MTDWLADLVGNAGRRPLAHWEYEHCLRLDGGSPIRPRGIRSEEHAVVELAEPSAAERAEIERRWPNLMAIPAKKAGSLSRPKWSCCGRRT
jgi:hypothetical protein